MLPEACICIAEILIHLERLIRRRCYRTDDETLVWKLSMENGEERGVNARFKATPAPIVAAVAQKRQKWSFLGGIASLVGGEN